MSTSIVRWLHASDTWDFMDELKPDAENPMNKKTAKSHAVSKWNHEPDTWEHDYLISKKPPSFQKVNLSKTNLWDGVQGVIDVVGKIIDEDGEDIQYTILINNKEVIPFSSWMSSPVTVSEKIPFNKFNNKQNLLTLLAVNETGLEATFDYVIVVEDRDTFTFNRVFDFKEDYIEGGNLEVIYEKGIALNKLGTGHVILNIPTEGKSKVKSVEVDCIDDTLDETTISNKMQYLHDLEGGKLYEGRILTEYNIVDIFKERHTQE